MQKINAAKEVLTDPNKRALYDLYGTGEVPAGMAHGNSTGFQGFPSDCKLLKIMNIFDSMYLLIFSC
jgi:DnaJ-class molecular chaperone